MQDHIRVIGVAVIMGLHNTIHPIFPILVVSTVFEQLFLATKLEIV